MPVSGTKREMTYLFESWCNAEENWKNSCVYTNITSSSGSIRRGVKKWLTRKELVEKLGAEVAEYVIAHKMNDEKLRATETRYHPDAPGCEALGFS